MLIGASSSSAMSSSSSSSLSSRLPSHGMGDRPGNGAAAPRLAAGGAATGDIDEDEAHARTHQTTTTTTTTTVVLSSVAADDDDASLSLSGSPSTPSSSSGGRRWRTGSVDSPVDRSTPLQQLLETLSVTRARIEDAQHRLEAAREDHHFHLVNIKQAAVEFARKCVCMYVCVRVVLVGVCARMCRC
jgi:hypothetical protein